MEILTTPERKLYSMAEVERLLGVSHAFLYNQILASGQLPTLKIGKRRFARPEAVDEYIARRERETLAA